MSTFPPFGSIPPQLATAVAAVPSSTAYVYEIKYDGYRAMAWLDQGKVRIATRRGHDWTETFREIARALERLPATRAILDGEVAFVDEGGRTDFGGLQNALGSTDARLRERLVFHAFDLLYLDGADLRREPLRARKDRLRTLLAGQPLPLRLSEDVADGAAFFREVCKHKLEGVIGKRAERPYLSGRSGDWIKVKCHARQEFVVVGFTPQRERQGGLGALLLAVREEQSLRYVGRVGTGFTHALLDTLLPRLGRIARPGNAPPVARPPRLPRATWVEPELVVEVRFTEWTSDGILRHPSFVGLRDDVDASTVRRERPAAAAVTASALAPWLDAVATRMAPFAARRPLVVTASPAELAGAGFVAAAEGVDALRTDDPEASIRKLAASAGSGPIELRGWGSRLPRWETPTSFAFALGGVDLPRARLVEAAAELRGSLRTLRLDSWPMWAGPDGLLLVVPIAPRYDWRSIELAAGTIAAIIQSAAPDRYALEPTPGKVAIDTAMNVPGGTTLLPYSPRADGAITLPTTWAELTRVELDPADLLLPRATKAVGRKRRTAPWEDLLAKEQLLPRELLEAAK